jgi:hypothetical protein
MEQGKSVKLFLTDGSSTGIVTAEVGNWTGQITAAPRNLLSVALGSEELNRTGVYILYGEGLDGDLPLVYVGESDDISARFKTHDGDLKKDYWERFIAITSKDMNLTKAHVKYIESRLIKILKEAKKCAVANLTAPDFNKLPRSDLSDMNQFIAEVLLVLPVIGVDFFRKPQIKLMESTNTQSVSVRFVMKIPTKGITATAVEVDGEFVVLAGAKGNLTEAVSFSEKMKSLRDQAFQSGRATKIDDKVFSLIENIAFSSPSAAAVFLVGTSRNGRTDWLVEGQSVTYGQWAEAKLAVLT